MDEMKEIISEHKDILKRFKHEGIYYKTIMVLGTIPLSYLFYILIVSKNESMKPDRRYSDAFMLNFSLIIFAVLLALVFYTKPINHIHESRLKKQRRRLKNQLNAHLLNEIPELDIYEDWKKMPQSIFQQSNLYTGRFTDYHGDDLMRFVYKGTIFYLSEVNSFRVFDTNFHGIFGFIELRVGFDEDQLREIKTSSAFLTLKQHGVLKVNQRDNSCYVGLDLGRSVFENDSYEAIDLLEKDILIVKDFVDCFKLVIDYALKS